MSGLLLPLQAGALLACGVVSSGVKNDCDPAFALLQDYVLHANSNMRIGSILGLGLAYAGSNRDEILQTLLPAFGDSKSSMEVVGVTALACGLVTVGSCNAEVTSTILQTLLEKEAKDLKGANALFLALGLGLNYLGKQEAVEVVLASLEVVPEPFKSTATTLVDVCAYAGAFSETRNLFTLCILPGQFTGNMIFCRYRKRAQGSELAAYFVGALRSKRKGKSDKP